MFVGLVWIEPCVGVLVGPVRFEMGVGVGLGTANPPVVGWLVATPGTFVGVGVTNCAPAAVGVGVMVTTGGRVGVGVGVWVGVAVAVGVGVRVEV
jgi:hypothetical protein